MGAKPISTKLKSIIYKTKTAYSPIGEVSYCPNCNAQFPPSTLYENFDQHVTVCLTTYHPSDQQRLRVQRKSTRKSSTNSNQAQIFTEQQTIEVYVRKWQINQQLLNTGSKQEQHEWYRKSSITKLQLSYDPNTLPNMPIAHISLMKTPIKALYLHHKINAKKISWKNGCQQLIFNPNTVVFDSLQLLKLDLFSQLKLIVTDDKVQDAGGLLREWARMVISGMISSKNNIFVIDTKNSYLKINKNIGIINNWIEHFQQEQEYEIAYPKIIPRQIYELFGVLLAKIIIEKVNIPYKFDYTFLRVLLNTQQQLQITDFITYDTGIYKSLKYLDNLYHKIYNVQNKIVSIINQQQQQRQYKIQAITTGQLSEQQQQQYNINKNKINKQYKNNNNSKLEYGQTIQTMKQMRLSYYQQLQSLQLTFSVLKQNRQYQYQQQKSNKKQEQFQLVKNGKQIKVQKCQQLKLYIQLIMQYYAYGKYHTSSDQQKQSIKINKYNLVAPLQIISQSFNKIMKTFKIGQILVPEQLEIVLNGLQNQQISVQDWKKGTQYKQPYTLNHKVIKYFWNYVTKLNNKKRLVLLKFVTGSENIPIFGFKNLQTNRGKTSCFTIEPMKYDKKKAQYPKAHTCFNRLQLPIYPNEETLVNGLNAITQNQFDGVWGIQ